MISTKEDYQAWLQTHSLQADSVIKVTWSVKWIGRDLMLELLLLADHPPHEDGEEQGGRDEAHHEPSARGYAGDHDECVHT